MKKDKPEEKEEFINPIDEDKITENPSTLPYAHTIGGVVIKPEDQGRIKGRALSAMADQTDMQMDQIKKQIALLAEQAREIQRRKEISELIYTATMNFEPLISHIYHLYMNKKDKMVLLMVAPSEWGGSMPFKKCIATVKLLADHTWDVIEEYD